MTYFFCNLIQSIRGIRLAHDNGDLSGELRWRDLIYVSLGLWPMAIRAKLAGEAVPRGIAIIDLGPLTNDDIEWAKKIMQGEHNGQQS